MFEMMINPDLQTRESVMAAAGRVQLALTEVGGGVRYIKLEAKAKDMPGARKRYTPVPLCEATHVFVSEKGYGTQRLGTFYPPKRDYVVGRFYNDVGEENPHLDALKAAVSFINTGDLHDPRFVGIEAESRCGLCGRELTDPVSVQRGIGPECAGKPTGSQILHASKFMPTEQLALCL